MKHSWTILTGLLAFCILLPGEETLITLEEWLVPALQNHPSLKLAEVEIEARTIRSEERLVWEDPELRISTDDRPNNRDQTAVSLRFPIPNLTREGALNDREEARLDLARAEYASALRLAREDLGQLYMEAAAAQMMAALAREQKSSVEAVLGKGGGKVGRKGPNRREVLDWGGGDGGGGLDPSGKGGGGGGMVRGRGGGPAGGNGERGG
ncbi:MAG: TolC family protein, partial [Puniceicoccaceae bacterium]